MIPKVIDAHYVKDYIIWLKFDDDSIGEINLEAELWGPVFEPLKNIQLFKKFYVHPELHTITWENGADFAPEFLYNQLKVAA